MRFLRSFAACAIVAMVGFAHVPAEASVPIDPGIRASVTAAENGPADITLDVASVAIVREVTAPAPSSSSPRSMPAEASSPDLALASGSSLHLPFVVDRRRRE